MSSGDVVLWGLTGILLLGVLLGIVFLTRVRMLAGRVGSFECARRSRHNEHWFSGVAIFTDDAIAWYRLVSLYWRPQDLMRRDDLEIIGVTQRPGDPRVVDVSCRWKQEDIVLGMLEDSYEALVSWIEAAPPRQATLV